jgi:hypothetical protein
MDWFEQLTGFREGRYEETRAKLKVVAGRLQSLVNGRSYRVGELLCRLQHPARAGEIPPIGPIEGPRCQGHVRQMHQVSSSAEISPGISIEN